MDRDFIATIQGKKILYCVLNWGLGHASRSIPLIRELEKANRVTIASDGEAGVLLKQELRGLDYLELPSYGIHYKYSSMHLNMLLQLPKIISTYNQEHKKIANLISDDSYDLIISDNRYGCFHKAIKSVFVGHQLNILGSAIATKINKRQISKFDECWIPDHDDRRLSGDLSDTTGVANYKFIGPLSRMEKVSIEPLYDVAIVLSGPEPKRSELEAKLIDQVEKSKLKYCLVRGTKKGKSLRASVNVEVKDFLESKELNKIMSASKMIICRSGYSSLMDLEVLEKPALIIPTKGQKEQEYLAMHYANKEHVLTLGTEEIDILSAYNDLCQD